MYRVTSRSVRVTIVAVVKQYVLHSLDVCVSVFFPYLSSSQSACTILYCRLWLARLYNIVTRYVMNFTIFGKKGTEYKMCVFIISTKFSEIFLILRKIQ
jgi:hypothetical protein